MADETRTLDSGAPLRERRTAAGSPFAIYKPGQGAIVRWCSGAFGAVIALSGAYFLYENMSRLPLGLGENQYVKALVPVALLAGAVWLLFRFIGQSERAVNFLIATEGEMKKVNWSTRREVFGATRVVIVTVLALAIILFIVDVVFMLLFSAMGVLHLDVGKLLFGAGES